MGPTLFGDVIPGPRGPQESELLLHLLLDQHDVLHNTFQTEFPANERSKKWVGEVSLLPNTSSSPLPTCQGAHGWNPSSAAPMVEGGPTLLLSGS